jgi:hypothetical protein
MKFQTAFHCSNGMLELFGYAIRNNSKENIPFIVHKAKMFISPSKVDAFLAAAYVLAEQHEEGARVLSKANPPVDSWSVVPVFRLTNAFLNSYRRALSDRFPFNFMKICLEHTDLAKDDKALKICHADWIRICGMYLSTFILLIKQFRTTEEWSLRPQFH